MSDEITLYQFQYSHFNEKARWALDYKGVPHQRINLLPGPHIPKLRKLTGQTATPILKIGNEFVCGSTAIIEKLGALYPDPPLIPADPEERAKAMEIVDYFDNDIGPRVRRAMLASAFGHPFYIANMFGRGKPALVRFFYALTLPLVSTLIKKGNGITGPESIEDGHRAAQEALDFIVKTKGAGDYLVGDRFSIADLTAASILAAAADPPGSPMERPKPAPPGVRDWLAKWHEHEGSRWIREIYSRHRMV